MRALRGDPILFLLHVASLIVAVSVHEFAHAKAADRLGDPTPRLQGRLTLNPLAHLDPIGTLMLFLVGFGWGRPVQFDPFNLRRPRRDAALISLAGPFSNIATATVAALVIRLLYPMQYSIVSLAASRLVINFLEQLIVISLVLAVFNLIPIHPLDGFKIVGGFLSSQQAKEWYQLERYGLIFLLFLLLPLFGGTPPISRILSPILNTLIPLFLPGTPII